MPGILLGGGAALVGIVASPASAAGPIGRGASQVWVLEPPGPVRSVVVYVHGWGELSPAGNAWVEHLRATGNAVVFPRYQANSAHIQTYYRVNRYPG